MRKTSAQIGQTTKHRKEPGTVEKNFSRTEVLNGLPMFWLIPLLNWGGCVGNLCLLDSAVIAQKRQLLNQ